MGGERPLSQRLTLRAREDGGRSCYHMQSQLALKPKTRAYGCCTARRRHRGLRPSPYHARDSFWITPLLRDGLAGWRRLAG